MATEGQADLAAFRELERAGWEQKADAYHELAGAVTRALADELVDAVEPQQGQSLLDVASGPGYVAEAARLRGASATGCDLAESMVALARRLHPELDVRRAEAEALPFDDASFDAVVSGFGLPHFSEPDKAVAEMVRVSRRGGRVALSTWGAPTENPLLGVVFAAMQEGGAQRPADLPEGPDLFAYADEASFAELLRGAGLDDVDVRVVSTEVEGTTDELWSTFLHGTVRAGAVVQRQPEAVQRAVRESFNRRVSTFCGSRGVELPAVAKVAVGLVGADAGS